MNNDISNVIIKLRKKVPLVQCITNHVTINDCANILLAFGASPAMCEAYDESFEFAKIVDALYLNLGTLTKEQEASTIMAAISAKVHNIPVVLDPVACPVIERKVEVIDKITKLGRIDVIKGNSGEIKFLAGLQAEVKGVDSIGNQDGLIEACTILANKYNCVVAATGKKDIVSDGKRVVIIENGVEMLTKVTGAGCMLGALCGGTIGVEEDKFIATCTAIVSMDIAGEKAYETAKLPGSFRVKLLDSIYEIGEQEILQSSKISFLER